MAALGLALIGAAARDVGAQTPAQAAESGGPACGFTPSDPVMAKWIALGGANGRLGCPTGREADTPASPQGTKARETLFDQGAILRHVSGPREGQTFAVSGCVYRLYFQYGGPGGWLGLPTSDPINTPDGQRQAFEGGQVAYQRAPDDCEATPTIETAATPRPEAAAPPKGPLDLFFDPARGDYLDAASAPSVHRALDAHYERLRTQAYVFTDQAPGTTSLKLYWNETLGAHMAVATADGERDALSAGDAFEGTQGFIYPDPRPGTAPLKQFRNPATQHYRLTATAEDEAQAGAEGYTFVRIEGYAPTAP